MRFILLTSAALLSATAAFSGNLDTPAAGTDWTGFYSGVSYGFASGENRYVLENPPPDEVSQLSGGTYGGFVGYRRDLGAFVLGGEVAVNFGDSLYEYYEGEVEDTYYYKSIIDLKAVAGYDMGRALVYVTAGASFSQFTGAGVENNINGWLAGAGVDVMVSDRFFVGVEYIYRDLVNDDYWGGGNPLAGRMSTWQFRAGMNF